MKNKFHRAPESMFIYFFIAFLKIIIIIIGRRTHFDLKFTHAKTGPHHHRRSFHGVCRTTERFPSPVWGPPTPPLVAGIPCARFGRQTPGGMSVVRPLQWAPLSDLPSARTGGSRELRACSSAFPSLDVAKFEANPQYGRSPHTVKLNWKEPVFFLSTTYIILFRQ